jgi:CDP-diacylglycerol--inositol 3-phosphatidyltransferase
MHSHHPHEAGSKFGAVLDMVTDRCCSAGLILVLSHLYPKYILVFVLLAALDLASHYAQMYRFVVLARRL